MKLLLVVCLIATLTGLGDAQSAEIPLQRGITVDQPIIHNAGAMPEADKEDAVMVTLTKEGNVYLGINQISIAALSGEIKNALPERNAQIVYIKADAHAPYSIVVRVMDSVRSAGIRRVGLLTAIDSEKPGKLMAPKGLEMLIVSPQ